MKLTSTQAKLLSGLLLLAGALTLSPVLLERWGARRAPAGALAGLVEREGVPSDTSHPAGITRWRAAGTPGNRSTVPPELALRAPAGRLIRYDALFERGVSIQPRKVPGTAARTGQEVRGILESRVYPSELAGTHLLAWRFAQVQVRSSPQPLEREVAAAIADDLGREVLARVSSAGRIEGFFFPRGMNRHARQIMRAILLGTQIVLPARPAPAWEQLESDSTGSYLARYRARCSDAGSVAITKIKGAYQQVQIDAGTEGEPGGRPLAVDTEGGAEAVLDRAGGFLAAIDTRDCLRPRADWIAMKTADGGLADIAVTVKIHLEEIEVGRDEEVAALSATAAAECLEQMDSALAGEMLEVQRQREEWHLESLRRLAAGHDMNELTAHLADLIARGRAKSREAYEAWRAMAALITLDENSALQARTMLLEGELGTTCANLVANALGDAGTPTAQGILTELLANTALNADLRVQSLLSLAAVQKPSPETETALRAMVAGEGELAANSLLILGVVADQMRSVDSGRAAALARFILAQERSFTGAGNTEIFLQALGNTASSECHDAIARYLLAGAETIRAAAVEALGRIPQNEVSGELSCALRDPSALVRQAALRAIAARAPAPALIADLRRTALVDADAGVRRQAIDYLGSQARRADCRAALLFALEHDPDPDLRARVRELLAS